MTLYENIALLSWKIKSGVIMVQSLKLSWTVRNRGFSLNYRLFCPLTVLEDQKLVVYVSKQEISDILFGYGSI